MKRNRLPRTFLCKGCQRMIVLAPPPAKDMRTQYCSRACKLRVWWKTHERNTYPSELPQVRFCECGIRLAKWCSYCPDCRPKKKSGYKPRPPRTYTCETCYGLIVVTMGAKVRWCSKSCYRQSEEWKTAKRILRARRKAIERGNGHEAVDPYAVFRRDKWLCQLCGQRTPGTLRGTCNRRAPELDHIVPLSRGGTHTYDNTQCLCRECNQSKGATVKGQLRLIGWTNTLTVSC